MATGIEAIILDGLLTKLGTLTLTPAMTVAYPGVNFTPQAAGYLRADHFPADTFQSELGDDGRNRLIGNLQVSVFKPTGNGAFPALEAAASIASFFKRGTVITSGTLFIRIIAPPVVGSAIADDPYIQIPVTIRYQVDAPNP